MRKFLSLIFAVLLCALAGFAQTVQNRWPVVIGVGPTIGLPGYVSSYTLDVVTTLAAFSFYPDVNKTVSKTRFWQGSHAGTITDYQCDLYSDTAGAPNASLAHVHLNSAGFADGAIECTGFTTPTSDVTSHILYWLVITNNTGTPGTNKPTLYFANNLQGFPTGVSGWGNNARKYVASWGTATSNVGGFEIEYSDGSVDGWLAPTAQSASTKTYVSVTPTTSEYAASFTTPANTSLKVRGIGFYANKLGSPASGLKFALYPSTGHTTLTNGTTATIPAANIISTGSTPLLAYLPATVTLTPGTIYKVSMIYDGTDGDTSNCYRTAEITIANNAVTKALGPMGGTVSATKWDGSIWAALVDTEIPVFLLILDTDGPFPATAGGVGTGRVVSQ